MMMMIMMVISLGNDDDDDEDDNGNLPVLPHISSLFPLSPHPLGFLTSSLTSYTLFPHIISDYAHLF